MRWVYLTIVALVAITATAFTIQNSTYEAPLQLDLWFAAWKLREPASVPVLMWSSFGFGGILAGLVFGVRSMRLASRLRALEQEIAVSGKGTAAKDPWAGA